MLARDVGIRFKGVEKTNVEEYCVSEGWIRVAAGNAKDRHGNPLTIKLTGPVEPYFREQARSGVEPTHTRAADATQARCGEGRRRRSVAGGVDRDLRPPPAGSRIARTTRRPLPHKGEGSTSRTPSAGNRGFEAAASLPRAEIRHRLRPAMRPNTKARSTETAFGAVPWKCPVISPAA